MATIDTECYVPDKMSDAYSSELLKTAPQAEVNIKNRRTDPFTFVDECLARGDLKDGLLKVRLTSSADQPLPGHFTQEFLEKNFEPVFKGAYREPSLKMKLFDVSSYPIVKNRAYRRALESVQWTGTLEALLRNWQDNQQLQFNSNPHPEEELASIFRNFRRNRNVSYPYVTDWPCSLFRIHYVDETKSAAWQQQHNFGVSLFRIHFSCEFLITVVENRLS
jgi:hypothetical protein